MTDYGTLEQARQIHRGMIVLRKQLMARHLAAPELHGPHSRGCELTLAQINMVMLVHDRGQATVKELAEALQVSPPSVSSMVDRLVEMGVLTREQSQIDRREVVIRLAADTESDIEAVERLALGALVEILEKIGPDCAEMWCEVHRRVQGVLAGEDVLAEGRCGDGSGEVSL